MKLFVDDWRVAPPGWTTARTITEAIWYLSEYDFEVVSLDHDIESHCTIKFPCDYGCGDKDGFKKETFFSVARYLALLPATRMPKRIYIHTANFGAGQQMEELLKQHTDVIVIDHNNSDLNTKLNFYEEERESK